MPHSTKEVTRLLKKKGWYRIGVRGSHVYYKHDNLDGKITVVNNRKDIPIGTYRSIMKQAGLL